MEIGIVFPQTEIGDDPEQILHFARAVEESGFHHLVAYDHVLGADWSARHDPEPHPYDISTTFIEPFVLFSFLAGHVGLRFMTGILVLPQRQTALVAKQAATLDVLSRGRLTLGVGVGWNRAEYQGLGEGFSDRGDRYDEQIEVLRRLWTEEAVEFHGRFHDLEHVGIRPLPVQRPIPIWLGGSGGQRVFERIGRVGDGWMGLGQRLSPEEFEQNRAIIYRAAEQAGRDRSAVQFQRQIQLPSGDADEARAVLDEYRTLGVTYASISIMGQRRSPEQLIDLVGHLGDAIARG